MTNFWPIYVLCQFVLFAKPTSSKNYGKSIPTLQNNQLKVINLFQDCTLTFPQLLPVQWTNSSKVIESENISSLVKESNLAFAVIMHFAFHQSSKIYKFDHVTREDKLTLLFFKLFSSRTRPYSNCRTYLVTNNIQTDEPTSENLADMMFPTKSFTKSYFNHFLQNHFPPNYYAILFNSNHYNANQHWVSSLDVEMHFTMRSTKIFLFTLSDFGKLISVHTGCYICPHKRGIKTNENKTNTISLVLQKNIPTSISSLNRHWELIHQKLIGEESGVVERLKLRKPSCFERYDAAKQQSQHIECIIHNIIYHLNCSLSECDSYIDFGVNKRLKMTKIQKPIFSYGVEYEGYKFYTVLGFAESSRIRNFDLQKFLNPFDFQVWLLLISLIVVAGIVLTCAHTPIVKVWALLIGILLEQGDDFQISRNRVNSIIIAFWLLTCIILRIFYSSLMYSNLTKPGLPDTLPTSFRDLFNASNSFQRGSFVGIDNLLHSNLLSHLRFVNETTKFDSKNQTFELQVASELKLFIVDISTYNFLNQFSVHGKSISCTDFNNFRSYLQQCETLGRFSLVYNIYSFAYGNTLELKEWLRLYSKRKLVDDPTQPLYFAYPLFWTMDKSLYFAFKFETAIANLVESGIAQVFKKRYKIYEKVSFIRRINDKTGYNVPFNLFAYFDQALQGINSESQSQEILTETDFKNLASKFRIHLIEIVTIFGFYGLLLSICCFIGVLEIWLLDAKFKERFIKYMTAY